MARKRNLSLSVKTSTGFGARSVDCFGKIANQCERIIVVDKHCGESTIVVVLDNMLDNPLKMQFHLHDSSISCLSDSIRKGQSSYLSALCIGFDGLS